MGSLSARGLEKLVSIVREQSVAHAIAVISGFDSFGGTSYTAKEVVHILSDADLQSRCQAYFNTRIYF